ncbi:MAG: hypothetical protein AB1578_03600 [Thermodesulfobacteriota bacterium]
MKSAQWMTPAILLAGLALLATGCGEGGKESPHRGRTAAEAAGRELGSDASGAAYVGADLCLGCHLDEAAACSSCHPQHQLWPEAVAAYLESRHAHGAGRMDASAETASCRLACHDPVGDGAFLEDRPDLEGPVPAAGLAAVGCEACHGGGAGHFGRGPLPDPRPGAGVCGRCHDNLSGLHAADHPEGMRIWGAYQASPHARSLNPERHNVPGSASLVQARCARCHTDEGTKLYRNVGGTFPEAATLAAAPPLESPSVIQCRTCHDAHNPGQLLVDAEENQAGAVVASAEYRTCSHCHPPENANSGEMNPGMWSGGTVGVGTFNPDRIIYDTHFDDPATPEIEGYNLKAASARTCRDCHDVHAADPTIHRQWARSGHGGRIGAVKAAARAENQGEGADVAIRTAGLSKANAYPWTGYPWKDGVGPWAMDLKPCQRCHTATGFANFATDPSRYSAARNDYSYLAGAQQEILYCWGCHSDSAGGLRTPGPIPFTYPGVPAGAYPDVAGSNLCLGCHTGLASGRAIRAQTGLGNLGASGVLPHYLLAGGVLFGGTGETPGLGYEFPGREYVLPATERHYQIGRPGLVDTPTGSQGPCVGCHFSSAEPHTLAAARHDPVTGAVFAIESQACAACHQVVPGLGDFRLTPQILEGKRAGFLAAVAVLKELLWSQGYGVQDDWPYFTRTNWGEDDEAGRNTLGAAFNFALLSHEPGAYVHNPYYAKQLLYDTIDWVANGALDHGVLSAIQTLPASPSFSGSFAEHYSPAAAIQYLVDLGR